MDVWTRLYKRPHIYIIEFKLNQSADKALQQIQDKDYASKYLSNGKQIVLVGINFSSRKRGIGGWKTINL